MIGTEEMIPSTCVGSWPHLTRIAPAISATPRKTFMILQIGVQLHCGSSPPADVLNVQIRVRFADQRVIRKM
jgi:hypothetical protein